MVSYSDDESDVEGHRAPTQKAVDDEAGPEGRAHGLVRTTDDVEGHRRTRRDAEPDGLYRAAHHAGRGDPARPRRQPQRGSLSQVICQTKGRSSGGRPFRFRGGAGAYRALSAVAARTAFTSNGVIPGCAARIRAA